MPLSEAFQKKAAAARADHQSMVRKFFTSGPGRKGNPRNLPATVASSTNEAFGKNSRIDRLTRLTNRSLRDYGGRATPKVIHLGGPGQPPPMSSSFPKTSPVKNTPTTKNITATPKAPKVASKLNKTGMFRSGWKKGLLGGGLVVGATAMLGLWTMKGGMSEARDIVHERYMQDFTYSRSMLQNSRVGLASGTNKMLNYGGTQGLTTAMHKTRHGR